MDPERVNRWLTLGANIGVLAGIGLLIFELQQNREMIRGQTRTQLAQGVSELLTANMSDAAYASILHRGNRGEQLTDLEQYQYDRQRNAFIAYFENVVYQYEIGLYDANEFSHHLAVIAGDLDRNPGIRTHWCKNRDRMSKELVELVEAQATKKPCPVSK